MSEMSREEALLIARAICSAHGLDYDHPQPIDYDDEKNEGINTDSGSAPRLH
jgi:hypothetical protein